MIDLGWLGQIAFTWEFFLAVLSIVLIDLVLAGDNAIVIALAARNLPRHLQYKAIFWGTFGAIAVRSAMTPIRASIAGAIAAIFMCQVFVNVGMVIGIMPVTGIPLPFMSHGGASLVSLAIGLGIVHRQAEDDEALLGIALLQRVQAGHAGPARPAPRRPKVNDRGYRRLQNGLFKGRVGYMNGFINHR